MDNISFYLGRRIMDRYQPSISIVSSVKAQTFTVDLELEGGGSLDLFGRMATLESTWESTSNLNLGCRLFIIKSSSFSYYLS